MCEKETDEIEITPAMIEAGTREMISFNRDWESDEDLVRRVYYAMFFVKYFLDDCGKTPAI